MRHRFLVTVAALSAACVLAACGASPTSLPAGQGALGGDVAEAAQKVYDRINSLRGQERTDELVRLAEEESQLNVYTSNTDIDDLVKGFTDLYDIEVNVYRANSESVLQRLLQETEAGYFGADVFETNALELGVANQEGLLASYEGELRDQVRKEGQAEGWTASRFNAFVVGWNTNLVAPGTEPKTLEELAGPEWAGRISMEVGDVDWFTAMYDYYVSKGKTEAEAEELLTRLASNAKVAKGHTVQGELLSAGQFAVTVSSYSHTIDKAADGGAPVSWRPAQGQPVQPVIVRPNGIGLLKTAANPAAAMLFVDYELTGGQDVFRKAFRIGSIKNGGAEDPLAGLELFSVPEQKLLEDPVTWNELYEVVLRNGQEIS
jgi:iron(III) transport system substrate-binding protein